MGEQRSLHQTDEPGSALFAFLREPRRGLGGISIGVYIASSTLDAMETLPAAGLEALLALLGSWRAIAVIALVLAFASELVSGQSRSTL